MTLNKRQTHELSGTFTPEQLSNFMVLLPKDVYEYVSHAIFDNRDMWHKLLACPTISADLKSYQRLSKEAKK